MKPNRLYRKEETQMHEYEQFASGYKSALPKDYPGDGMRTWESWAALEAINWPEVDSALDIGSFWSGTPFYLAKKVKGLVVASDTYQWLEERRLENYTMNKLQWEQYVEWHGLIACQHDVVALPYKDQSYDLVTAISVLEHVPDWKQALSEILRVGRRVVLTVDAWPEGRPYENYGRCFSFDDLDYMAAMMESGMVERDGWEEFEGTGRTMAAVRKIPSTKSQIPNKPQNPNPQNPT